MSQGFFENRRINRCWSDRYAVQSIGPGFKKSAVHAHPPLWKQRDKRIHSFIWRQFEYIHESAFAETTRQMGSNLVGYGAYVYGRKQ